MRFQDYIVDATQHAADEVFRYAKAVPEDKLDWKPLDAGRSVLDQAREMAKCPMWACQIIADDQPMEMNEEVAAAAKAEMMAMGSLEACQAEFAIQFAKFAELVRGLSDERLKATKWLPFDGGRDFTVAEMAEYPRWNINYHLGQIGYIQTLYGDRDMH